MRNIARVLLALVSLVFTNFCAQPAFGQAGRLDSSFGNGGVVITSFSRLAPGGQVNGVPFAALQQPDGKIVVVGQIGVLPDATGAVGLVRYLPNGALDAAFGQGGVALAEFDNFISTGNSLAFMPDGRIVVAGEVLSSDGSFDRFAIARFNPNGTLDTSFGGDGKVSHRIFLLAGSGSARSSLRRDGAE